MVGGGDREATLASGRLSLNWQPTAKDFVQLSSFWQGDSLLAQGRREAGGMVNLGYRRPEALAAVDRASARVGDAARAESLIAAALKELAR